MILFIFPAQARKHFPRRNRRHREAGRKVAHRRIAVDDLRQRTVAHRQPLQNQRHAGEAVPARMHPPVDHAAAVALAADFAVVLDHLLDHVDLADLRGEQFAVEGAADIFQQPRGLHIDHHGAGVTPFKHLFDRQRDGVVRIQRLAAVGHHGQAVAVRVLPEADVAMLALHQFGQLAEVLRQRLRRTAEAVDPGIDRKNLAAELLQKSGAAQRADAVRAVDRDAEAALPDQLRVDHRKNPGHVFFERPLHEAHFTEILLPAARQAPLAVEVEKFGSLAAVEESAAAADEFERVPLGRIVAGGDRDRAGRTGAGHGELDGRSRHHAEFHDLTARRKESGDQRVLEHGAGRAGIPPDHDAAAALIETECGTEFGHQPGGQPLADDAAHAAFRKLQCIDPAQGSLRSFR